MDNFTTDVAKDLDKMLQSIVLGEKPHCFRVLAFTMRRLRGDSEGTAWRALGSDTFEPRTPLHHARDGAGTAWSALGSGAFESKTPSRCPSPIPPPFGWFGTRQVGGSSSS